jgi:hypothetical protein
MDLATWLREASTSRPASGVADIGILQGGSSSDFGAGVGADDGYDTLVQATPEPSNDGGDVDSAPDDGQTASAGE